MIHEFVSPQKSGVVRLPRSIRDRLNIEQPGVQLEFTETEAGFFVRSVTPVPAEQAWFWTEAWQEREREAENDIAAGNVHAAESAPEFIDQLRGQ